MKQISDKFFFPSEKEVKQMIAKLEKENWDEFDGSNLDKFMKETHERITNISQIYSSFYLKTPKEMPFEFNLFRVRKLEDINNKYLRSEYSYPPAKFVTKNLRANLIGNPIFYAADHPLTALLEYIQQWDTPDKYADTKYVISSWKFKKDISYLIAPFIPENLKDINAYTVLGQFSNDEYREKLNMDIDDDRINGIRRIKNYFSNLFINDSNRTISSYLGHYYIYKSPINLPCIFLYPSLKAKHSRNNFGIHPNTVDEHMILSHMYVVDLKNIKELPNKGINFNFTLSDEFGVTQNSKIIWTSIKDNLEKFKKLYKKEWEADFKGKNKEQK